MMLNDGYEQTLGELTNITVTEYAKTLKVPLSVAETILNLPETASAETIRLEIWYFDKVASRN